MAKKPIKTVIPEPLVQAVAKYCEGDTLSAVHVISSVLKANAHPKADTLEIADKACKAAAQARALCYTAVALGKGFKAVPSTPIAGVTPPTKTISPHAPVAKGKKDYWVKVVTSIDLKDPSAWGIKGRFINPEDTATLPENTTVMVMTKKGKNKLVYVMRSKHGKPTNIPFPSHSPHAPLCVSASVSIKAINPDASWWAHIMGTLYRTAGVKAL